MDDTIVRFWHVIGQGERTEEEPKGVVERAPTSVPGRVFRASQQNLREDEGGAGRPALTGISIA